MIDEDYIQENFDDIFTILGEHQLRLDKNNFDEILSCYVELKKDYPKITFQEVLDEMLKN
jgi:hypothetical protein